MEKDYWNDFVRSGKVEDYIKYKNAQESALYENDRKRDRYQGTNGWGE